MRPMEKYLSQVRTFIKPTHCIDEEDQIMAEAHQKKRAHTSKKTNIQKAGNKYERGIRTGHSKDNTGQTQFPVSF